VQWGGREGGRERARKVSICCTKMKKERQGEKVWERRTKKE
jgi:hypothetical protein